MRASSLIARRSIERSLRPVRRPGRTRPRARRIAAAPFERAASRRHERTSRRRRRRARPRPPGEIPTEPLPSGAMRHLPRKGSADSPPKGSRPGREDAADVHRGPCVMQRRLTRVAPVACPAPLPERPCPSGDDSSSRPAAADGAFQARRSRALLTGQLPLLERRRRTAARPFAAAFDQPRGAGCWRAGFALALFDRAGGAELPAAGAGGCWRFRRQPVVVLLVLVTAVAALPLRLWRSGVSTRRVIPQRAAAPTPPEAGELLWPGAGAATCCCSPTAAGAAVAGAALHAAGAGRARAGLAPAASCARRSGRCLKRRRCWRQLLSSPSLR